MRPSTRTVVDRHDRELVTRRHEDRRTPIGAANESLLSELRSALKN